MLESGRHMVLGDVDGPHRLWLRNGAAGRPLAYVIVRDDAVELRQNAMRRLDRRLAGEPPTRALSGLQPTAFQRQRLSMLLDILDAVLSREEGRLTTHEIARRHVYAGLRMGRGNEWKSSSERRRTQRLIDEALALMRGGYRRLLRG
ncbi:MAG: DUF2285 domain-containing protein [Sphingomonadaceae bacterium]|nr:DUF2285 domain-containing protein [Sphingomonadaceae bacterium]